MAAGRLIPYRRFRLAWRRWVWILAIVVGLAGLCDGLVEWRRSEAANRAILQLDAGRDLTVVERANAVPEMRLARALLLARQNRYEETEALLADLADRPGPVQARAAYNLGNLYAQRALGLLERGEPARAVPFVQLAKTRYRRALQLEPGDFAAKYNLESALRWLPDLARMELGGGEETGLPEEVKPWSTLPGFPRGLP